MRNNNFDLTKLRYLSQDEQMEWLLLNQLIDNMFEAAEKSKFSKVYLNVALKLRESQNLLEILANAGDF